MRVYKEGSEGGGMVSGCKEVSKTERKSKREDEGWQKER